MGDSQATGKLEANLVNFFGSGQYFSEVGNSSHRNKLVFHCGGFDFQVFQDPRIWDSNVKLEGTCFVSSRVLVDDLPVQRVEEAVDVLNDICWMLTFAGMSRVVISAYTYSGEKKLEQGWFPQFPSRKFRKPLPIWRGEEVSKFVNECYPSFCKYKDDRKLPYVIDFLSRAEWKGQATEVKLILAFVVLESLKYTFAKLKPFLFKKGRFYDDENNLMNFKTLVSEMLKDMNMVNEDLINNTLPELKRARDEILHQGFIHSYVERRTQLVEKAFDLIYEYILRMLGYHGKYYKINIECEM